MLSSLILRLFSFLVTSVLLIDERGALLPIQEAEDVWTTAAYDHSKFGDTLKLYFPSS